jgi:hypothetical protein
MGAPTYQARFSAADVLGIASSQQTNFVVPQIRALRRDFMVVHEDFDLDAGDDTLPLPERAVGRGIRDLWFTEQTTSPAVSDFKHLKYVDLSDILNLSVLEGDTYAYYFQDDDLKFHPELPNDAVVRLFYLSRPGDLVETSRTCTISSLTVTSPGVWIIGVDAVPSNIILGSKIDVVKVDPSYKTLVKDLTVVARTATSVTISSSSFSGSGVAVGDIVSLKRETSVVQLPEDAWEVLVWATANEMAVSLGIDSMIAQTEKALQGALNGMRQALVPRTEDPQTIINPNNLLRSGNTRFSTLLR